jgi:putative ABC transport system substrate-binding protein
MIAAALAACGGDDGGKPDRTIAFVRTTPIASESQQAFLDELADAGWVVGDNLTVLNDDPEVGVLDSDESAALVRGFVDDGVDAVVALSTTAAIGAVDATDEVPIVVLASDPVASGLVTNPRAPEGNLTGVAFKVPGDRTIDVARQLVGGEPTIGLLHPSEDPGAMPASQDLRDAAESLGVALVDESWGSEDAVGAAVDRLVAAGVDVIVLANSPDTVRAFPVIEEKTRAAGIPVVANTNSATFAVVVLAPQATAAYQQIARQAARLLDGTEVSEVPVEEPGAFHLLVRTGVADSLGVTVPQDLVDQADEIDSN